MRLILGVSADGYLARTKNDKMDWLGAMDKRIFRILTGVGGDCAVSAKTYEAMPNELQGRSLQLLSSKGYALQDFANDCPEGWLLGGPTLGMLALKQGLIEEVHMCHSECYAHPDCMAAGSIPDYITRWLKSSCGDWLVSMETKLGNVTVRRWTKNGFPRV